MSIIIKNTRKGNGLMHIPKINNFKAMSLYSGTNEVPLGQWEIARTYSSFKKALKAGNLEEIITKAEVSKEEKDRVKDILSLEEFCNQIEMGKEGVIPEAGGYFLVTLKGSLGSFRVKSTGDYARLTAYKQYVESKGGALVEKVTAKKLSEMSIEKKEELIKDCYNMELLKKYKKSRNENVAQLAREQLESIEKFGK